MIESLKHKAARLAKKKAKYEAASEKLAGGAKASKKLEKVSGKLEKVEAKRTLRQAKKTATSANNAY